MRYFKGMWRQIRRDLGKMIDLFVDPDQSTDEAKIEEIVDRAKNHYGYRYGTIPRVEIPIGGDRNSRFSSKREDVKKIPLDKGERL